MTDYYLCSVGAAKQHCIGTRYIGVYSIDNNRRLYRDHIGRPLHWLDGILLHHSVDKETQLVLALVDPMFRKVTITDMSANLYNALGVSENWTMLR